MVAITFDSNKFDRKQSRMLSKSKKSLDKLYETFYKEVARIGATTGFDDPERDFFLKDYPKADKAMQSLLRKLCDRITGLIEDGCQKGWSISNAKNSALINALGNIVPDRKDFINRINMRSESALNSFQDRKVNGLGLSERVWKSQQQVKGQIELALELGLAEGKSAPTLSRDVRSYLREPEKLFRRVRDKKGHLRLSKSAAAYHPGQGVYRSSYKNALRMTVTENNIAYRTADFVQQQEMDFVIGIEIRLSDNHPCDDICDDLAGVYPKKFKFTGWHPFCRCYTIPKLAEREELNKWARMSKEERDGYHFKGEARSMPKKFTDWVDRNAERIKSAKSLPYFIKDNFLSGDIAKGLTFSYKSHKFGQRGKDTRIDPADVEGIYERNATIQTFTKEQLDNHQEIAKRLHINIGEQMPHYMADSGNVNPVSDNENCVFCSFTYELRRRGFNVKAKPYVFTSETDISYIAGESYVKNKCAGYGIVFNGLTPQIACASKGKSIINSLNSKTKEVGRYHLSWDWDEQIGHSAVIERFRDGSLVLYDGQKNNYDSIPDYFKDVKEIEVYRTDNATINLNAVEQMVDAVIFKKKSKKR